MKNLRTILAEEGLVDEPGLFVLMNNTPQGWFRDVSYGSRTADWKAIWRQKRKLKKLGKEWEVGQVRPDGTVRLHLSSRNPDKYLDLGAVKLR